jgi:regulation of enolase protein 1 (concanavalin A-like superfamily)
LPTGWTDQDIGAVNLAGSASYNSGAFTITGAGVDISGTADGFNYAYQSVSGDTTVIARVASENGSQAYAKAGPMIRETTNSGSVHASVLLTPTNGVAMEIRLTTGGTAINVVSWIHGVPLPQWARLVRSGNTFSGYYSSNAATWTLIATTNITMATNALAGLAVSAHDTNSLNTATIDSVTTFISGIYQVQNEASGLVLNNQGATTNGAPVTQWTLTSSSNLDWTFISTTNGYYQINSSKSGLDAAVAGASTANGAGIVQWAFGTTGDDLWKPVQNSDGSYTFFNLHSGLVLEDPGSSTNKTTQMDQWSTTGGSNQKWNLLKQ